MFLRANPFCAICGTDYATEVHHKAGRLPSVFFDQSLWLALCSPCHRWVTEHPAAAVQQGWSVRRHELREPGEAS